MPRNLYMVKLGGSVITDVSKVRTARLDQISRLLNEIREAATYSKFNLIIGHGGGSFPHNTAKQYGVQDGLVNGNSRKGAALTRAVASELDNIFVNVGAEIGLPVFPFSPSSFATSDGRRIESGKVDHIKYAIRRGFVPVVYGDVIIDKKQGVSIASTEEVFRFLSSKLKPTKVIIGTDVDGVFDRDPIKNTDAKLIADVDSTNIEEVLSGAGGARKVDVTGGMRSKLELLHGIASSTGATCYIANATTPGLIKSLLLEEGQKVRCTTIRK